MRSPHALAWRQGLEDCGFEVRAVASLGLPSHAGGQKHRASVSSLVRHLGPVAADRLRTWEAAARFARRRTTLREAAAAFSPDLVHALRLPYEGVTALSSLAHRHPVVLSLWGQDLVRQAKNDPLLSAWIRRGVPRAAGVVADVPGDLDRIRSWGLPAGAPTLLAAANFGVQATTMPQPSVPRVVYTRGLRSHVDHRSWLESVALVNACLSRPVEFVGIGLAEAAEARQVRDDPALAGRLRLTEALTSAEFEAELGAATVTVSPATSDGMPISVLSSLAHGSATLVGPLPQFRNLAARCRGLVVMEGLSPAQIAAATLAALADAEHRPSGPKSMLPAEYDRDHLVRCVPDFYEAIAAGVST